MFRCENGTRRWGYHKSAPGLRLHTLLAQGMEGVFDSADLEEGLTVQFDYKNPNAPSFTSVPGPPLDIDWSNTILFDEIRARHEDESARRLRWCLDNNLLPAHDYIHKAPGDDSRFMVNAT